WIWEARHSGNGARDPIRARTKGPLFRHLPGHAVRRHRICSECLRTASGEQHRVRCEHAVPGHLQAPRSARRRHYRRYYAFGSLSGAAQGRFSREPCLRIRYDFGEASSGAYKDRAAGYEMRYSIPDFGLDLSGDLFLIAGPCVIESREHVLFMASELKKITSACRVPFVFKASYDKANRTSIKSFRGPGLREGLDILGEVRQKIGVPVLSDVHEPSQCEIAGEVLDIL